MRHYLTVIRLNTYMWDSHFGHHLSAVEIGQKASCCWPKVSVAYWRLTMIADSQQRVPTFPRRLYNRLHMRNLHSWWFSSGKKSQTRMVPSLSGSNANY